MEEIIEEEGTDNVMFENIPVDGRLVTTYVGEDGQRLYMDWESSSWKVFPDAWYPSTSWGATEEGDDDVFKDDDSDPRLGEVCMWVLYTHT